MCGRYFFEYREGNKAVTDIIAWISQMESKAPVMKIGEIYPTEVVPVLIANGKALNPRLMKWGFSHPMGKGLIINARSETAWEKPMFAKNIQERRCLIPALHYFEWEKRGKERIKYAIKTLDDELLYMAGLYRQEKGESLPSFTILTKQASKDLAFLHDRMPVILPKEVQLSWLSRDDDGKSALEKAQEKMECHQAS